MYQETTANTSLALSELCLDPQFAVFFQDLNTPTQEKNRRKLSPEQITLILLVATLIPSILSGCNLKEPGVTQPLKTESETVATPEVPLPFTIIVEGEELGKRIFKIQTNKDLVGTCRILKVPHGHIPTPEDKDHGDVSAEGDCHIYENYPQAIELKEKELEGSDVYLVVRGEGGWKNATIHKIHLTNSK